MWNPETLASIASRRCWAGVRPAACAVRHVMNPDRDTFNSSVIRTMVKLAFSASMTRYISTGSVRRRRRPRLSSKKHGPSVIRRSLCAIALALRVRHHQAPQDYQLQTVPCPQRPTDPATALRHRAAANMRDRAPSINDQTHRLLAKLRGVLIAGSRHGNILPAGPSVLRSDGHHQGSTSTRAGGKLRGRVWAHRRVPSIQSANQTSASPARATRVRLPQRFIGSTNESSIIRSATSSARHTCAVTTPRQSPRVDVGLYESLLTERLNSGLAQTSGLRGDLTAIDDAEQALVLARHLSPLIERQLRAARGAEERAQSTGRILAALGDSDLLVENVYQNDPAEIQRLDAVTADMLGSVRPPRPATPLSDAALMTNARNEPTLAAYRNARFHEEPSRRSALALLGVWPSADLVCSRQQKS